MNTDIKEARKFGLIAGIIWGTLSILLWRKHGPGFSAGLFCFSVFLVISAVFVPSLLRPVHTVWLRLTHFLGSLMNRLILSIIFFLILTPIGLMMRLSGKDFMGLKHNPDQKTCWSRRDSNSDPSSYENQF